MGASRREANKEEFDAGASGREQVSIARRLHWNPSHFTSFRAETFLVPPLRSGHSRSVKGNRKNGSQGRLSK